MENTLHHQLKDLFREPNAPIEVQLGRYRIDVVNGDRLVEIQRSGLASIRTKIENLLSQGFKVDVIKPIVARKRLIKLECAGGKEIDRRWSPATGSIVDLFDELLYFTRTFPHPQLRLIAPLVTIEEIRFPGQGKRRRRRNTNFLVQDRLILEMHQTQCFASAADLCQLLPADSLANEFSTLQLAGAMGVRRYQAQKIAYVMRKIGALIETRKIGNAIQYRRVTKNESRRALLQRPVERASQKTARQLLKAAIAKHYAKAA